jgi:hypothetical protein
LKNSPNRNGVLMEDNKIRRVSTNEDLVNEKKIIYIVNEYFQFTINIDMSPRKDVWRFFDTRNTKKKSVVRGNVRESISVRDRLVKDVDTLKIMDRKEFKTLLTEIVSNVNSLIDKIREKEIDFLTGPEKQEEVKEVSVIFGSDGHIYEQVHSNGKSGFVTLNDNTPKYYDTVDGYNPISGDEVEQQAILLPSKPIEYESTEKLIEELDQHIHRYLDIPDEYRRIATYYILMSWLYEKINTLPYLRAMGDSGTGKSRMLDVIGRLLYKPSMVAGAVTPAPIYRLLQKWKGSLIIDEADFKDSSEQNEVITILNCGFEKNRPIIRCNKDNPDDLRFFNSYGPKVIGTRRPFRDYALESRCITNLTKKTRRQDIPRVLNGEFYEEQDRLRNMLLRFRLEHFNTINVSADIDFDFSNIDPRIEQVMRGFLVLFNDIPGVKERFREFIIKFNNQVIEERAESMEGWIINTIVDLVIEKDVDDIILTTTDITDRMNEGIKSDKRKKSPVTIGKYIRTLGITTKAKKIDGKTKKVLLFNSDFLEVAKSYIPRDESYNSKISGLRVVTDVTVPSLGLPKKNKQKGDLVNYISEPEKIHEKKVSEGLPHSTVTSVTSVVDTGYGWNSENEPLRLKFESLKESKIKEIPRKSVTEMFGIDDKEIDYLVKNGLIMEVSRGKYSVV